MRREFLNLISGLNISQVQYHTDDTESSIEDSVRNLNRYESKFLTDDEVAFVYNENLKKLLTPLHMSTSNLLKSFDFLWKYVFQNSDGKMMDVFRDKYRNDLLIDYDVGVFNSPKHESFELPILIIEPITTFYTAQGDTGVFDLRDVLKFHPKNNIKEVLERLFTDMQNATCCQYIK